MWSRRGEWLPAGRPVLASILVAVGLALAVAILPHTAGPVGDAAEQPEARAAARPETVTIGWVGDTTTGSVHGTVPGEGRSLFADVRHLLREPDLMIGNLEGTLSVGGTGKCAAAAASGTCFAFQASPATARGLRWAGFDVLNLANNHSYDFGPRGLEQTLRALSGAGIATTGLPGRGAVVSRRDLTIAVLGFAAYPWASPLLDHDAAARLVGSAAEAVDLVVVAAHVGAEGSAASRTPEGAESHMGEPRGDSRGFARAVIDAGADLVLASGPHVLRGLELYRGRLIAYSLGNFAGVHNFSTAGDLALSGLLTARLERDGRLRNAWLHSLRLDASGRPAIDPSGAAVAFVAARSREDFADSAPRIVRGGRILPGRSSAAG